MSYYRFSQPGYFGQQTLPYVTWDNGFTDEEIDTIIATGENYQLTDGTVGTETNQKKVEEIRRSKVSWLPCNTETQWLYDRLAFVARQLNGQFYQFDIEGFFEDLQYTTYNSKEKSHYDWHVDFGGKGQPLRKFSLVLALSDPTTYEGGEFQIQTGPKPMTIPLQKGQIVAFPAYILHRVAPVTKGIRKSLVAWTVGPPFK